MLYMFRYSLYYIEPMTYNDPSFYNRMLRCILVALPSKEYHDEILRININDSIELVLTKIGTINNYNLYHKKCEHRLAEDDFKFILTYKNICRCILADEDIECNYVNNLCKVDLFNSGPMQKCYSICVDVMAITIFVDK